MELRELGAFREVARQSSFSRAAARLGYVQSTVSAQVQSLERDLGARLFDRLGRTVRMTAAGEALLPHAEHLLEAAASAQAAVTHAVATDGQLVGSISVSAPESLLTYRLPAVLSRFRFVCPGVSVRLQPTPIGRFRGDPRQAVACGAVDLAFVLDTPLDIPGFSCIRLIHERVSVIVAPAHHLASGRTVGPADLAGEPLLLPEAPDAGCAYRGQFERQLADARVDTDGAMEFASIEAVKQCVVAGMGVSVLPGVAVAADVAAGRLAELAWTEPFDVWTQLVWNARRSTSPAMGALIETARDVLGVAGDATYDPR
jgi:DNA-binding transcriptional LysR family regulator